MEKKRKTSWQSSAKWYDKTVGEKGHYYHEKVIFPQLLPRLELKRGDKVLDLACGQGVLSRHLPEGVAYTGMDASPSLIKAAKKRAQNPLHHFLTQDLTKPLKVRENDYTHAVILLALQNIENPKITLEIAAKHLTPNGKLFLILNHPCFRIPRQSDWGIDEKKKLQYRRVDRYLSPLKIPIQTQPGREKSATTWSFHHPLSSYVNWLFEAGFLIDGMQEWISDKRSTGNRATMENRAREEFPLFLFISSRKVSQSGE